MDNFIKTLIDLDNEMISSIRYKFDNNVSLDKVDLFYLENMLYLKKYLEKRG